MGNLLVKLPLHRPPSVQLVQCTSASFFIFYPFELEVLFCAEHIAISTIPFPRIMQLTLSLLLFSLTSIPSLISAHGVLTAVEGSNGVVGQGFGVVESTPRDGSRRRPFQVRYFSYLHF
jgi:hypothetical protein